MRLPLIAILKALLLAALTGTLTAAENPKPNILILLADDLGYATTGAYGAEAARLTTPHIDRLAAGGARFTNAYVTASVCGFDKYFGFNSAQTDYFHSPILFDRRKKVTDHQSLTFQFTDEAIHFIDAAADQPSFQSWFKDMAPPISWEKKYFEQLRQVH